MYRLDQRAPERKTPSQLRADLKSIRSHATKLLNKLGYNDPPNTIDGPDDWSVIELLTTRGGPDENEVLAAANRIEHLLEVLSVVEAAAAISNWSERSRGRALAVRESITPKGFSGDIATNDWIAAMMGIYKAITSKEPATSIGAIGRNNESQAGGPLIDFLTAAGKPIGVEMTGHAWRERVRSILRKSHAKK